MGTDKLWLDLWGRPLIAWTLEAVLAAELFDTIVVVTPQRRWLRLRTLCAGGSSELRLVEGGRRRQESVRRGLEACADADTVCVHDAARPLAPPALFTAVVAAAQAHGAATAAVAPVDTVKRIDIASHTVVETLDRSQLVAVQTPQAFARGLLQEAHARAAAAGHAADDDAALVERLGLPVHVVPGTPENLKVTRLMDLIAARAWIDHREQDRGGPTPAGASA